YRGACAVERPPRLLLRLSGCALLLHALMALVHALAALFHALLALGHALAELHTLFGCEHRARVEHGLRDAPARGVVPGEHLLAQRLGLRRVHRRRGIDRRDLLAQRLAFLALRLQVLRRGARDLLDLRALRLGGVQAVEQAV